MIDVENQIYTRLAEAVCKANSNASVSGTYIDAPTTFPTVTIEQIDSYDLDKYQSEQCEDQIIGLAFEINVYSNDKSKKKSECKSIMKIINDTMKAMNFVRIALTPIPNLENATIYRLCARYRGVTDGHYFYRK